MEIINLAYYTLPTGNQTGELYDMFKFIGGTPTGGLFWVSMLLVVWVIAFMALKQYSTSRAWTFASFFCAILSIFMAIMDYLAPKWMYFTIFMFLIGLVWLKLEEG